MTRVRNGMGYIFSPTTIITHPIIETINLLFTKGGIYYEETIYNYYDGDGYIYNEHN